MKKENLNMLTSNRKQKIEENMQEVINTTREIRRVLTDEGVPLFQKKTNLPVYKTILDSNKTIISASMVLVNLDKKK